MAILCGTDLSEASEGALHVAAAIAASRGDREIVLVHIHDPDVGGTHEAELEALRQRLDAQAQTIAGPLGPSVRAELVVGPVAETLVGLAETETCELIVIMARSKSAPNVGTTTARIISRTQVPVLVVRDPAPWIAYAKKEQPIRVMLGMDDSATCDLGVQWLQALRARGPVDSILAGIYYPDEAAERYGLEAKSAVDADPQLEKLIERDMLRRFGGDPTSDQSLARPSGRASETPYKDVVARARRGLGRIGDHLVELANVEKADVVVVGTSQKTGLGRLGSVSSVVVHDAAASVLCVPPQAVLPTITVPLMKTVMVATDLSSFSNRAVPFAFAVADPDAEIHVVHVVEEEADVDAPEVMRALYALAPAGAKQVIRAHIVRGEDAARAVAQCAARLGIDVICIASHGRSGITRALVGSVADRLLRATRLPVLVLRPA